MCECAREREQKYVVYQFHFQAFLLLVEEGGEWCVIVVGIGTPL